MPTDKKWYQQDAGFQGWETISIRTSEDPNITLAQTSKTTSYINSFNNPDSQEKALIKTTEEKLPFFQQVRGDGFCGAYSIITGIFIKCLNDEDTKQRIIPNLKALGIDNADEIINNFKNPQDIFDYMNINGLLITQSIFSHRLIAADINPITGTTILSEEHPNCETNIKSIDQWWKETGFNTDSLTYPNGETPDVFSLEQRYLDFKRITAEPSQYNLRQPGVKSFTLSYDQIETLYKHLTKNTELTLTCISNEDPAIKQTTKTTNEDDIPITQTTFPETLEKVEIADNKQIFIINTTGGHYNLLYSDKETAITQNFGKTQSQQQNHGAGTPPTAKTDDQLKAELNTLINNALTDTSKTKDVHKFFTDNKSKENLINDVVKAREKEDLRKLVDIKVNDSDLIKCAQNNVLHSVSNTLTDLTKYKLEELLAAITAKNVEETRKILEKQPDLAKEKGVNDSTPLHSAAQRGNVEIVKLLLEKGADINAKNNRTKMTPLHVAAQYTNSSIPEIKQDFINIINLLLEKGADINARDFTDKTAADRAPGQDVKDLLTSQYKKLIDQLDKIFVDGKEKAPDQIQLFKTKFNELKIDSEDEAEKFLIAKLICGISDLSQKVHNVNNPPVPIFSSEPILTLFESEGTNEKISDDKFSKLLKSFHLSEEQSEGADKITPVQQITAAAKLLFHLNQNEGQYPNSINALNTKILAVDNVLIHIIQNPDLSDDVKVSLIDSLSTKKPEILTQHDEQKNTPLHIAAESGNIAIITKLLEKGANISAKNNANQDVLEVTTDETIRTLLKDKLDAEVVFTQLINTGTDHNIAEALKLDANKTFFSSFNNTNEHIIFSLLGKEPILREAISYLLDTQENIFTIKNTANPKQTILEKSRKIEDGKAEAEQELVLLIKGKQKEKEGKIVENILRGEVGFQEDADILKKLRQVRLEELSEGKALDLLEKLCGTNLSTGNPKPDSAIHLIKIINRNLLSKETETDLQESGDLLAYVLDKIPSANDSEKNAYQAISLSIVEKHPELAESRFKFSRTSNEETLLDLSCKTGRPQITKRLLEREPKLIESSNLQNIFIFFADETIATITNEFENFKTIITHLNTNNKLPLLYIEENNALLPITVLYSQTNQKPLNELLSLGNHELKTQLLLASVTTCSPDASKAIIDNPKVDLSTEDLKKAQDLLPIVKARIASMVSDPAKRALHEGNLNTIKIQIETKLKALAAPTPPPPLPGPRIPLTPQADWNFKKDHTGSHRLTETFETYATANTPSVMVDVHTVIPLSSVNTQQQDPKTRGIKSGSGDFRTIAGVYEELDFNPGKGFKDNITDTFLHILNFSRIELGLEKSEAVKLIQLAKEHNGIGSFINKHETDIVTAKFDEIGVTKDQANNFSKCFQQACEANGIYTGRSHKIKKFVGLRLPFIPDEVVKKMDSFEPSDEDTIDFCKNVGSKVKEELNRQNGKIRSDSPTSVYQIH